MISDLISDVPWPRPSEPEIRKLEREFWERAAMACVDEAAAVEFADTLTEAWRKRFAKEGQ